MTQKLVYSIPASKSYKWISNYPFIYECPANGRVYSINPRTPYYTFRKTGGYMEYIFSCQKIIRLNPLLGFERFLNDPNIEEEYKKRVHTYCDELWGHGNYANDEKKFHLLSWNDKTTLEHNPKPPSNQPCRAYYFFDDLINKDINIILPSNKSIKA